MSKSKTAHNFKASVELKFGYEDKESPDVVHKNVVFSKRPTGADFISAGEASDGQEPDFTLALMQPSISAFGNLPLPVPLTVLLSLNWLDRELLTGKFYEFLGATDGEREAKSLENGKVELSFGIERDAVKYAVVEFGAMLTAYDEIAIRRETETAIERSVLTLGREIVRLSTADGSRQIDGGLTLEELKNLDWTDFVTLQKAEEDWRNSFRQ